MIRISVPENQPGVQPSPGRVCPNCGKVMQSEWNSCPSCGWASGQLTKPEATVVIPSPTPQQPPSHAIAIAAIILSLIGIFFAGIIFGLVGLVLGVIAVGKKDKWGYAGLIIGLIVFILTLFSWA